MATPQNGLSGINYDIMEEFDRDEDYDQDDFEEFKAIVNEEEEESIEKLRREELRKSIVDKDKAYIKKTLSQPRVPEIES